MRHFVVAILAATVATPVFAQTKIGEETVISYAGAGGLQQWQAGPPRSGIAYVRDRTLRWYRLTLSGPCTTDTALDRFTYTTDVTGTFDRFQRVMVGRYPQQVCGVTSIQRSEPPKGQPGAPKIVKR